MKRLFHSIAVIAVLVIASLTIGSCVDDIDTSNRYTFTGHTIASFLEEHNDVYSSFITILNRGGKMNLLKAYGTYTCFAPTNEAVAQYLVEQDSIYRASLLPGSKKVIWTGVTSPNLEDLSDSMCTVISQTHILPATYLTTEMEGDVIPTMNLNDRYLTMTYGVDENQRSLLFINSAQVIASDEEVENGVIHTISAVMNPSSNTISAQIGEMKFLSLFSEALEKTGLDNLLQDYKDYSYTEGDKRGIGIYGDVTVPYPLNRYYGFTAFCESDQTFNDLGIFNLNDLYAKCKEWYPNATDPDFTSENNALYKFISYHLVNKKLLFSRLVCYNIKLLNNLFNSESNYTKRADRYEYYETMQGTLIKVTRPMSNSTYQTDVLINYTPMLTNTANPYEVEYNGIPVNIKILDPQDVKNDTTNYKGFTQEALNGSIHIINHPLIYNEDVMAGYVLNEIMRFDFWSLLPELTNNDIRWTSGNNVVFGTRGDYEFFLPDGYCKNSKYNTDETRLYYLSPHTSWANYQGDEMMCLGAFDFEYRIPHVPAGTYEIRMGYSANSNRHIVQFYVDDEITGIPVDLRILASNALIGWVNDSRTDDNGVTNDKEMKNRGFLKGPSTTYYGGSTLLRNYDGALRKVITTKYLSEGDHWLRFKNVKEDDDGKAQFMHDYLEIVPVGWMRREDISLEDKRK